MDFPVITSQLHENEAERPKLMPIHIYFGPSASRPFMCDVITEMVYCRAGFATGIFQPFPPFEKMAAILEGPTR